MILIIPTNEFGSFSLSVFSTVENRRFRNEILSDCPINAIFSGLAKIPLELGVRVSEGLFLLISVRNYDYRCYANSTYHKEKKKFDNSVTSLNSVSVGVRCCFLRRKNPELTIDIKVLVVHIDSIILFPLPFLVDGS